MAAWLGGVDVAAGRRRCVGRALREEFGYVCRHAAFADGFLEFLQIDTRCHTHLIEWIHFPHLSYRQSFWLFLLYNKIKIYSRLRKRPFILTERFYNAVNLEHSKRRIEFAGGCARRFQ